MTKCEVEWCSEHPCEPSTLCRHHILELPPGDPRRGPSIQYFSQNVKPGQLDRNLGKFFYLTTSSDGYDQLSEVPQSFYAPQVPVESE
jgi:hypothetical protein